MFLSRQQKITRTKYVSLHVLHTYIKFQQPWGNSKKVTGLKTVTLASWNIIKTNIQNLIDFSILKIEWFCFDHWSQYF